MKKIPAYAVVIAILIVLLTIKFIFFPGDKSKANALIKEGEKKASPVTVFIVGDSSLKDLVYSNGTLVANEEAELKVEASGNITYLNQAEGIHVKAGTLILKINDDDLRAQLEKINIQLKLAGEMEARQRSLLQIAGISKQEYDISLAHYHSLKADSTYQQALISKTEVRAPFDGIIGIRNVNIGSYISPAIPIASMYQIDPVKIDFSLPEKYSILFKVGGLIYFRSESSEHTYTGRITVKDPKIDLSNRSVRYRAICSNTRGELLPGAFVTIELKSGKNKNTLFVPTTCIVPVLKGKKVFVIRNGIAEGRMVKTGFRTDDHVQILSGLSSGDSVVVKGNYQLKEGAPVKSVSMKG
jgi:membrane fusion protein (multidrug efflux system)